MEHLDNAIIRNLETLHIVADKNEKFIESEDSPTDANPVTLQFMGDGASYFRIWIVNIFLSIVTLGIYSAWAKVRTARYFYGNTLLDGSSFEYHAKPKQILIGRIIAVIFLAVYTMSSSLPVLNLVMTIALVLFIPFIIRQALRFKYAVTSYRGIRFSFSGDLDSAYLVYFFFPIVSVFTLHLLWPWVQKNVADFHVNHIHYGTADVHAKLKASPFYLAYILVLLLMFGVSLGILSLFLNYIDREQIALMTEQQSFSLEALMSILVLGLAAFSGMSLIQSVFKVIISNHIFNSSVIDKRVNLSANMKVTKLFWIYLSNLIGIVVTLGLFIPWAKVRLAKYRVESVKVSAVGGLDGFVGEQREKRSALGEELGDAFDLDIAGVF